MHVLWLPPSYCTNRPHTKTKIQMVTKPSTHMNDFQRSGNMWYLHIFQALRWAFGKLIFKFHINLCFFFLSSIFPNLNFYIPTLFLHLEVRNQIFTVQNKLKENRSASSYLFPNGCLFISQFSCHKPAMGHGVCWETRSWNSLRLQAWTRVLHFNPCYGWLRYAAFKSL